MTDAPRSAPGLPDTGPAGCTAHEEALARIGDSCGAGHAGVARAQLEVLAVLADAGVPARWLTGLDAGGQDPEAAYAALDALVEHGVCTLSRDGALVRLEDAAAVRAGMDDMTRQAAEDRAARLLGRIRLDRVRDPRDWRREVEDLVDQLRALGAQRHSHPVLGREEGAAALAHAARLAPSPVTLTLAEPIEVLVAQMGAGHAHVLTARNSLAAALRETGDPRRAVPLFEQVLKGTTDLVGEDHPLTLTARNNLAAALREAGEPARAVLLYEEVVRNAEQVLGPSHPDTLSARNNLAYAHECAGSPELAARQLEQLVEQAVRQLGEQHPYVPSFLRNLERVRSALAAG
ncbi:MAG: tetratricopeptide repeat protein [Actinomyces sp.]|uniref:tetratricopeptide repeat protein n=1 Tax=Actinomyces sp. TaxID=29317 RepID=UPI0026DBBE90|nr:tetratricopeptide repeat protein [Actinomyces sp.]MDO4244374.1 tetratricopeptide repeat protein [Actinomyces sp.]